MRAFVRVFGLAINWEAYGELEYSVRSGRPAMEKTLPSGFWNYLAQHPEETSIFNAAMLAKAQGQIPAIVGSCDFSPFNLIGDIAGGRGHLLRAILEAAPESKGVLFRFAACDEGSIRPGLATLDTSRRRFFQGCFAEM